MYVVEDECGSHELVDVRAQVMVDEQRSVVEEEGKVVEEVAKK